MLHLGAADALIHIIICALRDEGEIFVCQVLNLNAEEDFFSYGFSSDLLYKSQIENLRFKMLLKTQYYSVCGFKFWQCMHFCNLVY